MAQCRDTLLSWDAGGIITAFQNRGSDYWPEQHAAAFKVVKAAEALGALPEPAGRWGEWKYRRREGRLRKAVDAYHQKYGRPYPKRGDHP